MLAFFFWRFNSKYCDILPIYNEEEESEIESMSLMAKGSCDLHQGTNHGKQVLIAIVEEKEKKVRRKMKEKEMKGPLQNRKCT